MLFNSYTFAVFFIAVFAMYWPLRRHVRAQNFLLLGASYVFYGWWDLRFLALIGLTTCFDYVAALVVDKGQASPRQRLKASLAFLALTFTCVVPNWSALSITRAGLVPSIDVAWGELLPTTLGLNWGCFLAAIVGVVLVNAVIHPLLVAAPEARRRKAMIALSITTNLAILGFFKYFNFFAESFRVAAFSTFGVEVSDWTLNVILPVGISFYTFQSMSYTIDVYRRQLPAVTSLSTVATYLAFFPQLVAGPIERASHLLPQFQTPRPRVFGEWHSALWLIGWGLFKKIVIADNMAIVVNEIFLPYDGSNPSSVVPDDGLRLLIGVYAFALQIYGDFSGYTDMARGVARLLGFDLMLNFRLPYFAISPSDFWKRWHISLSSWLRDYLYIPLGGNRGGNKSMYRNLMLTMILGGLWHGAAFNFILWGIYHGGIQVIYRVFFPGVDRLRDNKRKADRVLPAGASGYAPGVEQVGNHARTAFGSVARDETRPVRIQVRRAAMLFVAGVVMFHLTCFGWLLFRAQNLSTIAIFTESIVTSPFGSEAAWVAAKTTAFFACFLLIYQIAQVTSGTLDPLARRGWFVRTFAWTVLVMGILSFASAKSQTFIYFAF